MNILDEIARHITNPQDFLSFSRVSSFCQAAAVKQNIRFIYNPIPWLLLPLPKQPDTNLQRHRFFSLSKGTSLEIDFPDAKDSGYYSSKGWLLVVDKSHRLFFLHPFTKIRIDVPNTVKEYESDDDSEGFNFIRKFILSVSPEDGDYIALILQEGQSELVFYRPGFTSWIVVNCLGHDIFTICEDIIYFQDRFYVVYSLGEIWSVDIKPDDTVDCQQVVPPWFSNSEENCLHYLVELDGKLLVINRIGDATATRSFEVFQVDLENNVVFKVYSLGSRAVFVGAKCSMSVEILEMEILDESPDLRCNCIYFVEDESYSFRYPKLPGQDSGVYDLGNGSLKLFGLVDYGCLDYVCLPMWVEQTL